MYLRDQEKRLLDAICAQPDDNTVRLVYADWLDDHAGDEMPGHSSA
ncbi:TIGR02996 domain-containing protein [Fimbriiglobus ruber]